jgi:RNA polymerase sigma-70 factor (ECF subfamily)
VTLGRAAELQALAVRSRGGDALALERLLTQSQPDLRRFARSVCTNHDDAEDAVQELLLILTARTGLLRAVSRFTAWSFAVIRHQCVRLARAALRQQPLEHDGVQARLEARLASLDDHVLAHQLAEHVAALPPLYREVFILRELEGQTGPEAARTLGISLEACKMRLHRARALVQDALRDDTTA